MKIVITGGAGFIGSNAACRYLRGGHQVVVVDNLSRRGACANLAWLREQGCLEFANLDIRDQDCVARLFHQHRDVDRILHLAGQVAVTMSLTSPRLDFEINALGTLNLLEGMREAGISAPLVYSSTNKVYGELKELSVVRNNGRYSYESLPYGVAENQNLDFHSPYGCSKGAADQYTVDYSRIYGIPTIVFRQSCIYGYRQFGLEDQGWVAWFIIASQLGRPITVYGDGRQVRDILFIDDLLEAFDAAFGAGTAAYGRVYNIGGGPNNVISIREVLAYIVKRQNRKVHYRFDDWRPEDQKVFVSDIRRAGTELGWAPKIRWSQGLDLLYDWVSQNIDLFR